MKKYLSSITIAILSQIVALGLHFYLTSLHYNLKQGTADSSSICSINEKLNCEAVSLSSYAEVFNIPLSLWGFAVNLVIFLLLLSFALKQPEDNSSYRWATTLSLFSLLGSVVMGVISILQMHVYCIFCMALYFFSGLTFCCLIVQKIKPKFISLSDLKSGHILLVFAIPIFSWVINDMNMRGFNKAVQSAIATSIGDWIKNPVHDFSGLKGLKMGAANAKFVIFEFADFQCIHCKHAAPTLEAFTLANKNTVELNYLPFPLDGKCNPHIPHEGNGISCTLAKAALCADEQGKGWQVHKRNFELFQNSDSTNLEKMAADLNLNLPKLKSCIDSPEIEQKLKLFTDKAKEVGVQGTPAIFVNGKQLPNANALPILQTLFDQLNKN